MTNYNSTTEKQIIWFLKEQRMWIVIFCYFLVSQSCPTLCKPMECSPSGSSVHGISQARICRMLPFPTKGSSQPRDQTCVSCTAADPDAVYLWAAGEEPIYSGKESEKG